jgi:hypothetical protein
LHVAAGCEVVLLLGEINCTEGLIMAVEKMEVRSALARLSRLKQLLHVPAGCEVVLLVGGIDCREGLLTAVEKLKVRLVVDPTNRVCFVAAVG